jgi:hypothetical protein
MPHPSNSHRPGHRPGFGRKANPIIGLAVFLFITLFWMGAATCFLLAAHRIARGLLMSGRAAAIEASGDSMTDEEKRTVGEYLRHDALRRF